jgi:hypothetical protein
MDAVNEAIGINVEMGDRGMLVTTLERSLPVLTRLGDHEAAATLGGALIGPFSRFSSLPITERPARDGALDEASAALGPEAYQGAVRRGESMSYDELERYASDLGQSLT